MRKLKIAFCDFDFEEFWLHKALFQVRLKPYEIIRTAFMDRDIVFINTIPEQVRNHIEYKINE